ncbi:PhoX family protein [Neosynechococcus sphagnicola]|uniref:PhoX family protein n=1 Tax=Neosynechococcus sphagnicola TaxID=1501145 RepID=UPI001EF9D249|nr:alkaline phosphatase PhoX [Neosynechococcus sphagnicola]
MAANLAGGTPTARPEDIEVNPRNPREVFISYTDGAPGSDGYPDSHVFQVSKTFSGINGTQQSGGLYKIIEDSTDSTGLTFRWQRFVQGGEAGSIAGAGFANVDNLVFDPQGNIWGVTDMSTDLQNGFSVGSPNIPTTIDHAKTGDVSTLVGVFGSNWMFFIPTTGPDAGKMVPFAQGPNRCEMTGPTFVGGDTLIISVQHPSEDCLIGSTTVLNRDIPMLDLNGTLFTQNRNVPQGSNWPSNIEGNLNGPPRPSVIGIRRINSTGRFV